jgi:hypothetical protein
MQKKYFALTLAAAALMSACSSDELFEEETSSNSGEAVSFSTYLTTRTTTVDNDALKAQSFGVYGYQHTDVWSTSNGTTIPADSTPNFMSYQKVKYANNAWTYAPIKYWSNNPETHYTFLAFAPYRRIKSDEISTSGDPKYTYSFVNTTAAIDTSKMFDLVSARSLDNTAPTNAKNEAVKLKFEHALSRINVQAKTDQIYYTTGDNSKQTLFLITNVTFSGNMFYTQATFNLADNTWSNKVAAGTKTISASTLLNLKKSHPYGKTVSKAYTKDAVEIGSDADLHTLFGTAKDGGQQYLYLIPAAATAGEGITVSFDCQIVTFDASLTSGYTVSTETRSITVPQAINQGKSYNWNFTFSLKGIEFDGTVNDWTTETTPGGDTGNVDQVINEQFYLFNDKTYTWSTSTATPLVNNGDGTHSVTVENLEHFMIGTAASYNTDNLYGFAYDDGQNTAQGACNSGKLLKLGTTYDVVNGSSAYYIWPANGTGYTSDDTPDNFSKVKVIFNPYTKKVQVVAAE